MSPAGLRFVDVSPHQHGTLDFEAVARSGVTGVIIRAFEGKDPDAGYQERRAGALAAGLYVGTYAYHRARHPGAWQADLLLGVLSALGPRELPPALDCEELDGVDPVEVRAGIVAWVTRIREQLGHDPILYTDAGYWLGDLRGASLSEVAGLPLWVADTNGKASPIIPAPWTSYLFWQWTWKAHVPGVPGEVDESVWPGTLADLEAFCGWPTSTTDTDDPIDASSGVSRS